MRCLTMPFLFAGLASCLGPVQLTGQSAVPVRLSVSIARADVGVPVAGQGFWVIATASGDSALVTTSTDGTVEFPLEPSHYRIRSTGAVSFEGRLYSWNVTFTVGPAAPMDLRLSERNARIAGSRADTGSVPSPGARTVVLEPAPAPGSPAPVTTATGSERQDAVRKRPWSIQGGLVVPTGDFGDAVNIGLAVGVGYASRVANTNRNEFRVDLTYNRWGAKDYGSSVHEVDSGFDFLWMPESGEEPSADGKSLQWYGVAGVMLGWRVATVHNFDVVYSDIRAAWGPRIGVGMRVGDFFAEMRLQIVSISGTTVHFPILAGVRF